MSSDVAPQPQVPDPSDGQLEYLHCNRCGFCAHSISLAESETNPSHFQQSAALYVSQCSHILCSDCIQNPPPIDFDGKTSVAHKCPLCSATSAIVLLTNDMQPDILKIISPFIESLDNAVEFARFQYGNAVALLRFLKASRKTETDHLKSAIKVHIENALAQSAKMQAITSENTALRRELHSIQSRYNSLQQQYHQLQNQRQTNQEFSAPNNQQLQPPPQKKQHKPAQNPMFPIPKPPSIPTPTHSRSINSSPTSMRSGTPMHEFSQTHGYQQSHQSLQSQQRFQQQQIAHQSHVTTPMPPTRLSLPQGSRPSSAMSGSSSQQSFQSNSPGKLTGSQNHNHMNTFASNNMSRPETTGSMGLYVQKQNSQQQQQRRQPIQPIPQHHHQQQRQQSNSIPNIVSAHRQRAASMVIDIPDLDDAVAFQMRKQQQQQRDIEGGIRGQGGGSRVNGQHGGRMRAGSLAPEASGFQGGKTILNRGSFDSTLHQSRSGNSGSVGTPQVYSTR
ncbi:hypothetical protein BJ741DRAFT_675499 [Chytriomyces cf. hyalinus JEL632]|nr:hypothetical protein BJ741DRAFT_675499 [Chytriomyces cf. hyalinus JEL632]